MSDTKTLQIQNKEESALTPGLYLVPTPIGNLRDMTLRALDVLVACDYVICEDSRVTGKLLAAYNIRDKKKIVYNDHADDAKKAHILSLAKDNILAVVSDAGTPMISDPGFKLVRDAMADNIYVTALPGANAVLPALQLSCFPCDRFMFMGFLPAKDKGVRDILQKTVHNGETAIFYESPKRIEKTLRLINDIMPERQIAIVREITKLYEESLTGTARQLMDHVQTHPLKGEIVLVIDCAPEVGAMMVEDIDSLISKALQNGCGVKELAADLALQTGLKKKDIYNRALALKKD